jgi:hypothetical protein
MKLDGYLSEYSLAEIFNLIYENNATGMLSIIPTTRKSSNDNQKPYYLWFEDSSLVAIATGLDGEGLLKYIEQQNIITSGQLKFLKHQIHQLPQPLGIYLRSKNVLDVEQVKILFKLQTIAPICKIFRATDRQYLFESNLLPVNAELTGLSSPVQELTMLGLRSLKDWSSLSDKLPDANDALQRWSGQQPNFRLDGHELQLWKLADGKTPLTKLVTTMQLSIDMIRQISYRLIILKLVQSVPTNSDRSIDNRKPIGTAFLLNLKSFLSKGRARL